MVLFFFFFFKSWIVFSSVNNQFVIHSSINGLGYFQVWGIANKAAMNICI